MSKKLSSLDKYKKGQAQILVVFMLGVVLFFLGYALAPAINDSINHSRSQSFEGYYYDVADGNWKINESVTVNCTSEDLSNQGRSICTQLDVIKPVWVGLMFGFAGMVIGGIAIR